MASKKISQNDIIEKDLFKDPIASAKLFLSEIKDMKKEIADTLKLFKELHGSKPIQDGKDIQEFVKSYDAANEQIKIFNQLSKEEITLQIKIAEINSELVKKNASLKVEMQEKQKISRLEAIIANKNIGDYQRLSAQLELNRKKYKDLAAQGKQTTKEAKDLQKEIQKLDKNLKSLDKSVGQSHRNVGNYSEAINKVAGNFKQWALGALSVSGAMKFIDSAVKSTTESNDKLKVATAEVGGIWDQVKISTGQAASSLYDWIKGEKSMIQATKEMQDAFSNFNEKAEKRADLEGDLAKAAIKNRKLSREYEIEIAKLSNSFDLLNVNASDSTKSLNDQQKLNIEIAKKKIDIVNVNEKLIKQDYDIARARRNFAEQNGGDVQGLLDAENKLKVELLKATNEISVAQEELNKTIREINRERFLRNIDINQEILDSQLEQNDSLLKDERLTYVEKVKIYKESTELTKEAFEEQRKLVEDYTNKRLDLSKLVNEKNERIVRGSIEALNLDETTNAAILKIYKERIKRLKDIREIARDIRQEGLFKRLEKDVLSEEEINKLKIPLDETFFDLGSDLNDVKKALEAENAYKDRMKSVYNSLKQTTNLIIDQYQKQKDAQLDAVNKEISLREKSIEKQEELAAKGLDNTLAYEKQKLAESEATQIELQKKKEQREKRLIYLRALSASIENESQNAQAQGRTPNYLAAGAKAIAPLAIAEAFLNAIKLKDGIENLPGPGTETSDSIPSWLSKGESVVKAEATKKYKGLPTAMNEGSVIDWFERNLLSDLATSDKKVMVYHDDTSGKLLNEIQGLRKDIRGKKEINVNWDGLDTRVETLVQDGMKRTIKHIRNRPRI